MRALLVANAEHGSCMLDVIAVAGPNACRTRSQPEKTRISRQLFVVFVSTPVRDTETAVLVKRPVTHIFCVSADWHEVCFSTHSVARYVMSPRAYSGHTSGEARRYETCRSEFAKMLCGVHECNGAFFRVA